MSRSLLCSACTYRPLYARGLCKPDYEFQRRWSRGRTEEELVKAGLRALNRLQGLTNHRRVITITAQPAELRPMDNLSGPEAAAKVGITYRMLDYWCRSGILGQAQQGVGSGQIRSFSASDVHRMEMVKVLREAGFELGVIAELLAPQTRRLEQAQKALVSIERELAGVA